jgi:peptide/nickel transport system permease protein
MKVVLRRIFVAVPLVLVVSLVVFVLVDLSPGDPAQQLAGESGTPAQAAAIRHQLGLDRPLLSRYGEWLYHLVRGDLGSSITTGEPVSRVLARRGEVTLWLLLFSLVFAVVIGTLLAVWAAHRPYGIVDRGVLVLSSLGIALPGFWLAVVAILAFAIKLQWLPPLGYVPFSEEPWEWFRHLILPSAVLSVVTGAEITRQLRTSLVDVMGTDYILAARARGISNSRLLFKHAMKNALAPVVTITGYRAAQVLGASVIIDYTFAMNGIGQLAVDASNQGDLPSILGIVVVSLVFVVIVNALVDLSYSYFNPRVRV